MAGYGKAFYSASTATALVAAAGTAPFFLIEGSATKKVVVTGIYVDGITLTAVEYLHLVVTKYSTAASGGTATSLTAVPLDSVFPASTANVVKAYTVAPTPGTAVGTLESDRILGQATVASASGRLNAHTQFDFHPAGSLGNSAGVSLAPDGVILNGVAEGIGLRFAAAPASAVTLTVTVWWYEVD